MHDPCTVLILSQSAMLKFKRISLFVMQRSPCSIRSCKYALWKFSSHVVMFFLENTAKSLVQVHVLVCALMSDPLHILGLFTAVQVQLKISSPMPCLTHIADIMFCAVQGVVH